jgi:hypothetical protein
LLCRGGIRQVLAASSIHAHLAVGYSCMWKNHEVGGHSFEGWMLHGSETHVSWNLQQTADVKFKVSPDVLFCKVGYHDVKVDPTELVSYIEKKKSSKLKLTTVPGAGLFYMPIPGKYTALDKPAKASETSLKHALRHVINLQFTPSGHLGETDTFSSSLEYFRVVSTDYGLATVQKLAAAAREFSLNHTLLPWKAVQIKRKNQ